MPSGLHNRLRLGGAGLLVFAVVGFIDAAFLTIKHYSGGPIPCALTTGCELVTTSSYATIVGIPVALLGALYYLAMIIGGVIIVETGSSVWAKRVALMSLLGLGASIYFVTLQAAVLRAYCLYCLGSAATSTALFLTSLWMWRSVRRQAPSANA